MWKTGKIPTNFLAMVRFVPFVIEPAYKDRLCIKTILCLSLGWSLYRGFTVVWGQIIALRRDRVYVASIIECRRCVLFTDTM